MGRQYGEVDSNYTSACYATISMDREAVDSLKDFEVRQNLIMSCCVCRRTQMHKAKAACRWRGFNEKLPKIPREPELKKNHESKGKISKET